ncbi:hypothetical protein H1S01_13585 [Heliobacterium chlorum]|uniref:Bacterial OB-fold domain-containing protein n=1 Tax=Heliobacterium chlorum TaxID=2698 RepID=A0ABR7T440_HELCL|nr:hypothetical protein [Heliobacterium chlorum]MBC9785534.1 hypothetical protein [Heliobacterium chlorum]
MKKLAVVVVVVSTLTLPSSVLAAEKTKSSPPIQPPRQESTKTVTFQPNLDPGHEHTQVLTGQVYKGAGSTLSYMLVTKDGNIVLVGNLDKLNGLNNGKPVNVKGTWITKAVNTEKGLQTVKVFNVISAEQPSPATVPTQTTTGTPPQNPTQEKVKANLRV